MKVYIKFFGIVFAVLFCSISLLFAQSEEDDWICGFEDSPNKEELLESLTTMQDTTLKVGLLLVQFADWHDSLDSRGGVGWSSSDSSIAVVDTSKYKYQDYWNIFFSSGTYLDPPAPAPGGLHPDWDSHGIRVYGSFTDYWWEVSHKNLFTQAAQTHPGHPWGGMYETGLVNRVDTTDSTVIWITLNKRSHYMERTVRHTLHEMG